MSHRKCGSVAVPLLVFGLSVSGVVALYGGVPAPVADAAPRRTPTPTLHSFTATPTANPFHATQTPTPTATVTATATLTATPTGTPIATTGDVPACDGQNGRPAHNPLVWHALVERDVSGAIICHYDHEHHDNPAQANGVFGLPGAWYGNSGQTISYPWQTFNATTGALENDAKHNGYKWLVETNTGCNNRFTDNPGCVTDYRVEVHNLATAADAVVRRHSFQFEARGCMGADCGTIRTGGWHDYGHLYVHTPQGTLQCVDLPTESCSDPAVLAEPQKEHSGPGRQVNFANWYGVFQIVSVQTHFLEFGPIDPANPTSQQQFQPPSQHNGGQERVENLTINLDPNDPWVQANSDPTGHVTFNGYADRYGTPATGCTAVGLDCVPMRIDRMPQGRYWWRGDPASVGYNGRDYDVSPAHLGTGTAEWIGPSN